MTLKSQKSLVRSEVLARTREMDPQTRAAQQNHLHERFPHLPGFHESKAVLLFVSAFDDEVETTPLLELTLSLKKRLICPRVLRPEKRLELREVSDIDLDLLPRYQSIREPANHCPTVDPREVDWALVPGVAFDPLGRRLGRGGGYYDRMLAQLRSDAPCWSLIFETQWVAAVPCEPHDQPLDGVADAKITVRGSRAPTVTEF